MTTIAIGSRPALGYCLILTACIFPIACGADHEAWPEKGVYALKSWPGPPVGIFFAVPAHAGRNTPILVVIPGARRNAGVYRDEWHPLAIEHNFIVLTLCATEVRFPGEHEYNAGGVIDNEGNQRDEAQWLFSVIDHVFDDFCDRFGSEQQCYCIYGHSAGGGFVHRYLLLKPKARVDRAIAANPAFFTMPTGDKAYPFGLKGISTSEESIACWLGKKMVIMLGDQDLGPRTKPLSNGPHARAQGPSVFARGLGFHKAAVELATTKELPLNWKLQIVHGVGHSNAEIAPYAVPHLFPSLGTSSTSLE